MRRNIRTIALSLTHQLEDRELHGLLLILLLVLLGSGAG